MTTEQYSIGYEEGYQAGWNEAMEAKPAQQQEPVARSEAYDMIDRFLRNNLNSDEDYAEYSKALDSIYTTQPQRKPWVGLTEEERAACWNEQDDYPQFAAAIETKLKDKNYG